MPDSPSPGVAPEFVPISLAETDAAFLECAADYFDSRDKLAAARFRRLASALRAAPPEGPREPNRMKSPRISTLPGKKAAHRWVTEACRANKGDAGAMREAVESLYGEAMNCLNGWRSVPGIEFHFALTIARPEDKAESAPVPAAPDPTDVPTHGPSYYISQQQVVDEIRGALADSVRLVGDVAHAGEGWDYRAATRILTVVYHAHQKALAAARAPAPQED